MSYIKILNEITLHAEITSKTIEDQTTEAFNSIILELVTTSDQVQQNSDHVLTHLRVSFNDIEMW